MCVHEIMRTPEHFLIRSVNCYGCDLLKKRTLYGFYICRCLDRTLQGANQERVKVLGPSVRHAEATSGFQDKYDTTAE